MIPGAEIGKMPIEIWPELGGLRRLIASAGRLFFFFDFDGTLVALDTVASLAALPNDRKAALRRLSARRDVVVVIASGRALDDVRDQVGLPVVYVGNHGLEIRGGGLEYTVPEARKFRIQLLAVCNGLRARLAPFRGALIENKRLTASIDLRRVDRSEIPAIRRLVESEIREYPGLRLSAGREAFEIRPNIAWDKGLAARWIVHAMGASEADAICIGDYDADENPVTEPMHRIGIRMGLDANTSTHYWVSDTEVSRLLLLLGETVEELRR